jgi:hypothetical protein
MSGVLSPMENGSSTHEKSCPALNMVAMKSSRTAAVNNEVPQMLKEVQCGRIGRNYTTD